MKTSRYAKVLVERVLNVLARRPRTVNMEEWMSHDESVEGKHPYCGTTACLAGHVALAAGFPPVNRSFYYRSEIPAVHRSKFTSNGDDHVFIPSVAQTLLGIPESDIVTTSRLFHADKWPQEFARAYYAASAADNYRGMSRAMRARLRHWAKTGA